MKIDPQLIGHPIATVFEVLLIHAGYQVIPIGIERTIRELRVVDADTYLDLVPERLQLIPDFFVMDLEKNESWMTEVKFRQNIRDRRLLRGLKKIQKEWAPFVLILAAAEPPKKWKGDVRHIRAFYIDEDTRLNERFLLEDWHRLQDVFGRLTEKWDEATILKAEEAILRIAEVGSS